MLRITATGLSTADGKLRQFAARIIDLRPFWRELGEHLADEAQARWPLRRRTGTLRRSLTWRGERLGKYGVFESSPAHLAFGSAVFYGRFAQSGTKHSPRRPLIHIDEADASSRFSAWLRDRAARAGLEVE